jgi:hypothetical protein
VYSTAPCRYSLWARIRIYFNDDQFFVLPLPPSAFHSVLYGPVFRLYQPFMVQADTSGNAYGGGEWRSLGWSAHFLSKEPPFALYPPTHIANLQTNALVPVAVRMSDTTRARSPCL